MPHQKKCACGHNLVNNQNKTTCLPGALFDSNCTSSEQCQLILGVGGLCSNHTCTCRPKYYASIREGDKEPKIICDPIVFYGDSCLENKDCQMKKLVQDQEQESRDPTMECMWGECRCKDNEHANDKLLCVPNMSKANPLQNKLHFMILFQLIWLVYSRI